MNFSNRPTQNPSENMNPLPVWKESTSENAWKDVELCARSIHGMYIAENDKPAANQICIVVSDLKKQQCLYDTKISELESTIHQSKLINTSIAILAFILAAATAVMALAVAIKSF